MPFDGSIENLEIGFNNRYILEALRAAGDEQVKLQLKGALNPMIIRRWKAINTPILYCL